MAGGFITMAKRGARTVKKRRAAIKRYKTGKVRMGAVSLNRSYPGSGLPNTLIMKHDYYEVLTIVSSTTAATNVYRLNSIFDPDATGVGNAVYYYDQMKLLYGKYCVYGVKVSCTLACESGVSMVMGFKAQNDQTVLTDASLALERPDAKSRIVTPGQRTQTISKYFPIDKLFGVRKQTILDENDYKANVGYSPANVYYLQTFAGPLDNATSSGGRIVVKMTYYVKWSDRLRQNQS